MTAVRKFLFDNDFGELDPLPPSEPSADDTAEDEVVEEEVVEEILPTFSEEELNAAREAGHAKGREEGIRQAAEATERQILDAVTLIGERTEGLFAEHREAIEKTQNSATMVISALARKVFPDFNEREGLGEIVRLARTILGRLRAEPRVVFVVNDTLRDAVQERLAASAETKSFGGLVEIVGDPAITAGDCRVEWADGGAERNTAAMLADIDRIIQQNVGETGVSEFVVPDVDASVTNMDGEQAAPEPVAVEDDGAESEQSSSDNRGQEFAEPEGRSLTEADEAEDSFTEDAPAGPEQGSDVPVEDTEFPAETVLSEEIAPTVDAKGDEGMENFGNEPEIDGEEPDSASPVQSADPQDENGDEQDDTQ